MAEITPFELLVLAMFRRPKVSMKKKDVDYLNPICHDNSFLEYHLPALALVDPYPLIPGKALQFWVSINKNNNNKFFL